MMNRSVLLFLSLIVSVVAFAPSSQKAVFQQARVIQGSASYKPLYMSDGKEDEASMEKTPEAPKSGTFYDDEVCGRRPRKRVESRKDADDVDQDSLLTFPCFLTFLHYRLNQHKRLASLIPCVID